MPYIKDRDRAHLACAIEMNWVARISNAIQSVPSGKIKGALNYVLCRITLATMKPKSGWSYTSLSDAVSVLRDAADEIERRMMAPYEDEAIRKNGDLPEFDTAD